VIIGKRTAFVLIIIYASLSGQVSPFIVYSGLDNLIRQNFDPVRGKKAALFCNHSSQTLAGEHILDVAEGSALEIAQLFILRDAAYDSLWPAPELLEQYKSENYHAIALRKPYLRPYQFRAADYILLDMQINGTADDPVLELLRILMLIAGRLNMPLIILDRPNYFSAIEMQGPVSSRFEMPFFHGLSLGESARYFNYKDHLLEDKLLQIIPLLNYSSKMSPENYPHLGQFADPDMKKAQRISNYLPLRLSALSNLKCFFHKETQRLLIYADWLDAQRLHRDLLRENAGKCGLELIVLDPGPLSEFSAFSITDEGSIEALFTLFRGAAVMYPNEFLLSPKRCLQTFGDDILNRLIVVEKRPVSHILHYWEPEIRNYQKTISKGAKLYQ